MRARTPKLFLGTIANRSGVLSPKAHQALGIALIICFGLSCGSDQEMRFLELGQWSILLPAPVTCSWSLEAGKLEDTKQPAGEVMALCNASLFAERSTGTFRSVHVFFLTVPTGSSKPSWFIDSACSQFDALKRPMRNFKHWFFSNNVEGVECQYGGRDVGPEDVARVGVYFSTSSVLMLKLNSPIGAETASPLHEITTIQFEGHRLIAK